MAGRFGVSFLVVLLCGVPAAADPPLEPRPQLVKPAQIEFNDRFLPNVITVKFCDGLTARLQDGNLTDLGTGDLVEAQPVLGTVEAGTWRRTYSLPEAQLTSLRQTAQQNLGRVVADPKLRFNLFLPPGADPAEVIDAFNALECVELALPIPKPVPPPLPPDFQPNQVYEDGGSLGVSAEAVWNDGITGATIKIADIEYSWNLDHLDLPPVTVLGFPPVDPFNNNNHGAAVLGEVAAINNGWGVTGIAHGAEFFVAGTWNGAVWDVGSAIITSLGQLGPGDVIIIEQQINGPAGGFDYVPIEWWSPWYDAIVLAVGNAVIVVEAAGNGGQNLDDAIFSTGNFGHWPFLPENDSGAIIVGAGAAPPGFGGDVDRSRLGFSTYGSTVDLQGWGQTVWTTGYGGVWSGEGVNQWYTCCFGGTSSATAIVAGAAALLEAAYQDATGDVLAPGDLKQRLQETGWPQQSGIYPASQNIGPRPDAQLAILGVDADVTIFYEFSDYNAAVGGEHTLFIDFEEDSEGNEVIRSENTDDNFSFFEIDGGVFSRDIVYSSPDLPSPRVNIADTGGNVENEIGPMGTWDDTLRWVYTSSQIATGFTGVSLEPNAVIRFFDGDTLVDEVTVGGPGGTIVFFGFVPSEPFDRVDLFGAFYAIDAHYSTAAVQDSDRDGIPDDEDACPNSDLSETIVIDGCDSGVENQLFEDGCTMADLIAECADGAANHGAFVSCVTQLAIGWVQSGLINGQEKGAIQGCAAQSTIPAGLP